MFTKLKNKYIGTYDFYCYVVRLAIPMILQSMITTFVSMVDNIMIGMVGTCELNGVSIANQYTFIFNVTVFGAISGASIFGTQYFGAEDYEGQKYSFRFRIYLAIFLIISGMILFKTFDARLISLFLSKNNDPYLKQMTLNYGVEYIGIMIFGLIPFAIGQSYSSLARECGETKVPMYGSLAAVGINIVLDYALIFGKLGMPRLGVAGAAIATVIAKTVEALVVVLWTHKHKDIIKCIVGVFDSFKIPFNLTKNMILKSLPLMFNEYLWSLGMIVVAQSYSVRGLDVVAARNITYTITDVFNVVYLQLGASIGIILGIRLGSKQYDRAKDESNKLIFFAIVVSVLLAIIVIPIAYIYPNIFNVDAHIKELTTFYIIVQAFAMPLWSFSNASYFVLRSGGKTGITFIFDFVYTWMILIPIAFCLTRFTNLNIYQLMIIITYTEIFKVLLGFLMVKSNIWIQNITNY